MYCYHYQTSHCGKTEMQIQTERRTLWNWLGIWDSNMKPQLQIQQKLPSSIHWKGQNNDILVARSCFFYKKKPGFLGETDGSRGGSGKGQGKLRVLYCTTKEGSTQKNDRDMLKGHRAILIEFSLAEIGTIWGPKWKKWITH